MSIAESATQAAADRAIDLKELSSLAVEGLAPMFDPETSLFCYRMNNVGGSLKREGLSHRYTMMTLLGLHEFEKTGQRLPFNVVQILESLTKNLDWVTNIGDLGVLLWTHSVLTPDRAPAWLGDMDIEHALDRYPDAREHRTMELAWFVTGLAHNLLTSRPASPHFKDLALDAYNKLEKNQGSGGFFGHVGHRTTLSGMLRGSIGSFADQVYPIYGMARLAQACGFEEALTRAVDCAQGICRVQGSLGQWWWHYDSGRGQVARKYPVYSVHQHGMAPMALFAVGEASGKDFSGPIYKGLQWIAGQNELGTDLRDQMGKIIWRCILPQRQAEMYLDEVFGRLRVPSHLHPAGPLRVLHECRPYELGWLLYAFAPRLPGASL